MVTISEVARKAGVSPSTVSLVLNSKQGLIKISQSTRERVLRVADELGYSPNVFAKSLRTKQTGTVLILVFDIIDPFNAFLMRGAEGYFASHGYHTFFCEVEHDANKLSKYISNAEKRLFEGILITANSFEIKADTVELLRKKGIPAVVIGRRLNSSIPTVSIDNEQGAYIASKHLLGLGHRDIGLITGPPQYVDSGERLEGVKRAVREHRIEIPEENIVQINQLGWGPEAGYDCMRQLLVNRERDRVTAVFAFDDISALGAIRAIYEENLKIPEDISIVGFDNMPGSAFYNPPLTTVDYGLTGIGLKGAKMLIELIKGEKEKVENSVTSSELIVRKSTRSV